MFRGYGEDRINFLISNGQTKSFTEGQTVYKKGETASGTFCVILSGEVNIISERGEILNTLGSGNVLGEIGTISPQDKRTITVRAGEPVEVIEWNIETVSQEVPGLFENLRDLAKDRTLNWYY